VTTESREPNRKLSALGDWQRKPGGAIQEASRSSAHISNAAVAAVVGRYDYRGPILSVTQEGGHVFAQLGFQPRDFAPKRHRSCVAETGDAVVRYLHTTTTRSATSRSCPYRRTRP
jgi:hypothetical protein